jgi:hypothetical protein
MAYTWTNNPDQNAQNYLDITGANLDELNAATDRYIDDLINEANGDLQFILKRLDAEHELALGTDETARAQFLEKVADKLEERVGRIPYDYEKYTSRELEDFARNSKRIGEDKNTALQRLNEDEAVYKQEAAIANKEDRIAQQEELAQRGILQGTRDQAGGVAGQDVQSLETDINARDTAMERALGRSRFDVTQQATRGLEDATLNKDRNIADITTKARRDALDQIMNDKFGREGAQRNYDKQKRALERQREYDKRSNVGLARDMTPSNAYEYS